MGCPRGAVAPHRARHHSAASAPTTHPPPLSTPITPHHTPHHTPQVDQSATVCAAASQPAELYALLEQLMVGEYKVRATKCNTGCGERSS